MIILSQTAGLEFSEQPVSNSLTMKWERKGLNMQSKAEPKEQNSTKMTTSDVTSQKCAYLLNGIDVKFIFAVLISV